MQRKSSAFVDQVVVNALTGATVAHAAPSAGFEAFTNLPSGSFGDNPAGII
ncbi:hypothetical protein [Hymenobacter negativus]|uniref:Uncharacterized protein n=1 Tax=Hymenobacter negativus TaxID=2795026 RepID=A0ABS3QK40_9BACT|nr:hypothetical protein [Hymenobacter negativus]MBO2011607.1 hypothetical protein [Hymenobacter negativus]